MPNKWTVLQTQDWDQDHYRDWGQPFLAVYNINNPGRVLWDGGPLYAEYDPARLRVVHTYGYDVHDDYEIVWITFYKTYRKLTPQPQSTPEQSAGWMAPSGVFYACSERGHRELADVISAIVYNSLNGEHLLEQRGWLKIMSGGGIAPMGWGGERERRLTTEQEATINRLASVGDDEWRYNLQQDLELYGARQ